MTSNFLRELFEKGQIQANLADLIEFSTRLVIIREINVPREMEKGQARLQGAFQAATAEGTSCSKRFFN